MPDADFVEDRALTISATASPTNGKVATRDGLGVIAVWLFICCGLIFLMVVVGGVTRLTLSGLSITEWKPVVGVVPPLSAADWAGEFAKYKEIPEYRAVHSLISLDEFKGIYLWEYTHRLLGRLIALLYAIPFAWFLVHGRLPRRLIAPLCGILLLGVAQGGLGWYMVESGLADRVEVSQYRLVAHLALALAIYAAILWVALGIARGPARANLWQGWRHAGETVLFFVTLTILAGGFVAGLRAGLTYNTFPFMDGRAVPEGYTQLHPFVLNWFENIAAVQFDHRLLAVATAVLILVVWAAGWRSLLPRPARAALHGLVVIALLQVALGITTLMLVVPIPLAAAHQTGAVLLLTAAIVFRHTLRIVALMDARSAAPI